MDLPTCPSCGQSVIDDDAVNCPFCGKSMSAQAAGKPQPKAATAAKDATATRKSRRGGTISPATTQVDDSTIETDNEIAKKAIPARSKPMKGWTHPVVCPMCETEGFVPEKAAGRHVKCPDKQCMVPVFRAPRLDTGDEEGKKKKAIPVGLLAGVTCGILLLASVGYWLAQQYGDDPQDNVIVDINTNRPEQDNTPEVTDDPNSENGQNTNLLIDQTNGPKKLTPEEIRTKALVSMDRYANDSSSRNRSRSFCHRLYATALIHAGEFEKARQAIQNTVDVPDRVTWFPILPKIELAWKLAEKEPQAARQLGDEAVQLAGELGVHGREPAQAAIKLAAWLIYQKREAEAGMILARHIEKPRDAQLAIDLYKAENFFAFDFVFVYENRPLIAYENPQAVSVALELAARRQWSLAAEYAGKQSANVKRDCLVELASAAAAWSSPENDRELKIQMLVERLQESEKGLAFARIAASQHFANREIQGSEYRQKAENAANRMSLPGPYQWPAMATIYEKGHVVPGQLVTAAETWFAIARLTALAEEKEISWQAVQKTMGYVRAMAPTTAEASGYLQQVQSDLGGSIRQQLSQITNIVGQAELSRAMRTYRKQVEEVLAGAQQRLQILGRAMSAAIEWGQVDQVWAEIQRVAGTENHLTAPIGVRVESTYRRQGANAIANQIIQRVPRDQHKIFDAPVLRMNERTKRDITAGKPRDAAKALAADDPAINENDRIELVISSAIKLLNSEDLTGAFDYIVSIEDSLLREYAFYYVNGRAATLNQSPEAWNRLSRVNISPTEFATAFCGLILGL